MSKFLSGRQSNLKLGVSGYTENKTVLETTGKVGIGTTDAQGFSLYVVGPTNITGIATFSGGLNLPDNKIATFGDGEDLKIYHDSSGQSYIKDVGTGDLNLTSDGSGIHLQSGGGETLARFYTDAASQLYYDGQQKLSTSGIGVSIYNDLNVGTAVTVYGNAGIVSATSFYGDGSNLLNTGATLSAAAGTQRLVVTSLTSGTMVDAATDSDLTYNATTDTLNVDNLIVAGNLTVDGDQTILNTTQLEVEDINIGIASASSKLNNAQLDGAGITIHGSQGDKTLTWDNSNSRLGFNTDLYAPNFFVGGITATGDVDFDGNLDVDGHTELDQLRVSGVSTFQSNVHLLDNDKLLFGDGDDLQIYHDTNNSYIKDNGTGSLRILGGNTTFMNAAETKTSATFNTASSVDLYYDNSLKFQTTGYGATVYNDLTVGTGVTIYGNAGIVSAISFYGDGSNLTNTGATLSATSGVERLVTTQLTSGTMVDAATDADLTFNAGNNTLAVPNIAVVGFSSDGSNYGSSGFVPVANGAGQWTWTSLQGASSVNTILNGFTVSEEGVVVGTAGSITQLDFRGVNITASANPAPNGIATISVALNQSLDSLDVSGIATFRGPVSNGSTTGTDGQYLKSTGVGVTWASFPTLRTTQTTSASANQTVFNFTYNVNFLDVFVNGVKLTSSEYTANNGSQITLNTPAFASDIVEFHSYNTVSTGGGGGGGGGASNLTGLADVNFPIALADDQLLQYNSSTNVWENVAVTSLPYATEAFVGLATAGLASEAFVGLATAGLASETFVGLATAGLASETFVGLSTAGLASEAFVGLATAGLLTAHQSLIGKANVTIGDNPPGIGTASGDLWWESDTAKGHIYYDDGSSAQWVEFNPASGGGGGGGGSYANSDVDSHLNTGTASSGEVLSWNGSDYDWVAQSGGGSGISLTDLSVTTAGTPLQLGALAYNNTNGVFTFTPPDIEGQSRQALSVGTANNPLQVGAISYNNSTGVFTYTPPDLSSYLTSYTETDPVVGAVNGIVKADGAGNISAATAGTDYLTPTGDGSQLTGIGSTDLVTTWTLGANGSSDYTFTGPGVAAGAQDPTIYLVRGQTYKFENRSGGHPFRIQYEYQNTSGTAYNDGIVNNGAGNGTDLYWEVRNDAPDLLHYQCTSHQNMSGRIVILGDIKTEGSWTATSNTLTNIDTITGIANNAIKTAEYTIHIQHSTGMQSQKVLVMQDGSAAYSQEYAIMNTTSNPLVSIGASVHSGNLYLNATPATGVNGITTYTFTRQTIR